MLKYFDRVTFSLGFLGLIVAALKLALSLLVVYNPTASVLAGVAYVVSVAIVASFLAHSYVLLLDLEKTQDLGCGDTPRAKERGVLDEAAPPPPPPLAGPKPLQDRAVRAPEHPPAGGHGRAALEEARPGSGIEGLALHLDAAVSGLRPGSFTSGGAAG